MKRLFYVGAIGVVCIFFGCSPSAPHSSLFPNPTNNGPQIAYNQLEIDMIRLDSISTSYSEFSGITADDKIYYLDQYFCWYYTFSPTGKLISRKFGQGRGPKETTVGRIAVATLDAANSLIFLGYQLDHYVYDSLLNQKRFFQLRPRENTEDIASTSKIYTHQYQKPVCRVYDGKAYFNMYAEHPDFNYLDHLDRFLRSCRNISEVDLASGTNERMLGGGYPDSYRQNPYRHVILSAVNFDIDKRGNFYVNYESDSLIFVYDKDYSPVVSFGYAGRCMDTTYTYIDNYADCREHYWSEREEKGYYNWVEYEDKTSLLFRSYQKESTSPTDGLQIYDGTTLIADVDVPRGMKIAEYIEPYYYSQIVTDDENETLTLYQFKLDK